HERTEAGEEAHDHVHAGGHDAHVQPREPRCLRVAADGIDLATVTRVAEDDMSKHRKGEEDHYRHRYLTEDTSLAHPDEVRFEPTDRAAGGEQKRRAAERRHAAERYHEGWHFQPGDRQALQKPSDKPDPDRSQGSEVPTVACRLLACADREAIGETAFRNRSRDQAGKSDQRADREVDAGG